MMSRALTISSQRVTDSAGGIDVFACGQSDAHDESQAVRDAHDQEHERQKPRVPEGHALTEAHGESAVDRGHHTEHAGQDHEDPVGGVDAPAGDRVETDEALQQYLHGPEA